MLSFIAALIPLYFVYSIIGSVFSSKNGAELLGSFLGILFVIWVFGLIF